jgi:hypothetical protein
MQMLATGRAAAISIAISALAGCHPSGDQTLEEMFDHTYAVEPTATLSVTNRDGSIRVYGAGKTHEIRVEAIKKAYSAERLKAISIHITAGPDSVSIVTSYPTDRRGFSDRSGIVDYVIVVPQSVRITKLELGSGEVLLEDLRSDRARAHLENGRLFTHNCFGNLELAVKTGNLGIVYDWWEEEEFTIRGRVQDGNTFAYIPTEAAFHLIAHTATGKIANDFTEKEARHAEAVNKIDTLVEGGGKTTFQFETQDGNIKISEHNP